MVSVIMMSLSPPQGGTIQVWTIVKTVGACVYTENRQSGFL